MELIETYSMFDKVVEATAFWLLAVISLWIVVTPVAQFVYIGRSPYLTLSIWYVAEVWYLLFRGGSNE